MAIVQAQISDMKDRWLTYARSVISCSPEHKAKCESTGGACPMPGIDSNLRWPGMLGPAYAVANHKILCIGQIHLAGEWAVQGRDNLGSLQLVMHQLVNGSISPDDFFDQYNKAYAAMLPNWGPWNKGFGPVLRRFGVAADHITYVNFARCWQISGTHVYDAMDACAKTFPIKSLYDIVEPDAVLAYSGRSVFKTYPSLMRGVPNREWKHFPGRRSFAFKPEDIADVSNWLAQRLGVAPH
jgi:hypothetical protein